MTGNSPKARRPKPKAQKLRASENSSLVDEVYEAVLDRILSGALASGTPVSEVVLARELGVSRTPVHDALRQLAKDGLVSQARNCRAVVANFSADDVYEIFEMRKLLEGHAAELAAGRMDRRQLVPLRATAESLRAGLNANDWAKRWADFDESFHRTIATASGLPRLCKDILRYRMLHRGFNKLSTDPAGLRGALDEHEQILDALEARDGRAAKQRMVAHIAAWQEHFIRSFPTSAST